MASMSALHPLPSEIRRREQLAQAEAVFGVQWSDDCSPSAARRVRAVIEQTTNAGFKVYSAADVVRRYGTSSGTATYDTEKILSGDHGTDEDRLDAVAAAMYAFVDLAGSDTESWFDYNEERDPTYDVSAMVEAVNDVLLGERIDWHWDNGKFVQRGSSEMHEELVKPATVLLDTDPRLAAASRAYSNAITRLSEGKSDVAITDAATAVQEMFRALGAKGNSISDQLDAAQRAKIITPTDRKLLKPIVDWLNADRSERGNAHHERAEDATKQDAWLVIHVAGALMLRLSNREPRDIVAAREKRDREAAARAAQAAAAEAEAQAAEAAAWARSAASWETPTAWEDDTPF